MVSEATKTVIYAVVILALVFISSRAIRYYQQNSYSSGFIDGYNTAIRETKQYIIRDTVYSVIKQQDTTTITIVDIASIVFNKDTINKAIKPAYANMDTIIKPYARINIKYYFSDSTFKLNYKPLFRPIKITPNYPRLNPVALDIKNKNKKNRNNIYKYTTAILLGALIYSVVK